MDVQKIAVFIQVVRDGSLAKAGRSLDLDPSVVSRAVSLLEKDLTVKLFQRTTRKLALTEEGQAFYQRVEPLIDQLKSLKTFLKDRKRKPSGVIRLTSPVSFGMLIINPLLPKFFKMYPDIEIDYLITDTVLNLLEQRVDVAIRFGHLDDSSFVAKKLTALEYIVCASPEYLKANPLIKAPTDLAQHSCNQFLFPGFNSGWRFKSKNSQKENLVQVKGQLRASNALVLKEAALMGHGISLLAKVLIQDELAQGQLIDIFPSYLATATEFNANSWLLYPSKDYLPAKTKAFIDFLSQEIR